LLCLFVTVAPAVKMAFSYVLAPEVPILRWMLERAGVCFITGMAFSAVVYFVPADDRIGREARLDIGCAYQVALALLTALFRHMMPWPPTEGFRDISPVGLLIFVFAA